MRLTPRRLAIEALREAREQGRPPLGIGAATGLVAAAARQGGADLIVVYNSGRYRSAGLGSLSGLMPYGNANEVTKQMLAEVVPQAGQVPVVAGICAGDPFCDLDGLVRELRDAGVAGVQNFPTVGLLGPELRADLEATGISFEAEVELMRAARRAGLLACAFVCDPEAALRMALAGVDVIAPHLGVTAAVAGADAIDRAAAEIDAIAAPALAQRDEIFVMFHGGPAVGPAEVDAVLSRSEHGDGFFAASAVERTPVGEAVEATVRSLAQRSSEEADEAPDFSQPPPSLPIELEVGTLAGYLRDRGLVDASASEVEVAELGGGLSNVVLRWEADGVVGVVKQSRPRLRVAEEWLSDVRRALNERDAIDLLGRRLRDGRIPKLTFSDDTAMAFGMECVPARAKLWKPELMEGRLDLDRAAQAGFLLRDIHEATRDDPAVRRRFVAQPLIDQNRLDPWYRKAASRHPDLAPHFEYAIARLLDVEAVLVHGDFVPKNIFLLEDGIVLLDYEVSHCGNPGYDVATFVNHMLLKGMRFADRRDDFAAMAARFWQSYATGMSPLDVEFAEQEALVQLGILMLTRVDGKSKVEYLVDHPGAAAARAFARGLVRRRPDSLAAVLEAYRAPAAAS